MASDSVARLVIHTENVVISAVCRTHLAARRLDRRQYPLVWSPECQLPLFRRRAAVTAGSQPRSGALTSATASGPLPRSTQVLRPAVTTARPSKTSCAARRRESNPRSTRFFDNREAAMYGAPASVVAWAPRTQGAYRHAQPSAGRREMPSPIEIGVTAFVRLPPVSLDPAARAHPVARRHRHFTGSERPARASALPSRRPATVCEIWAEHDPQAAKSPQGPAVAVGVFGFLLESMLHLVESGRLDEAPEHIPALVTAGRKNARPRQLRRAPPRRRNLLRNLAMKLGLVTPVLTLLPRAHASWEETGTFADVAAIIEEADRPRVPPLHLLGARRDPERGRRDRGALRYWDPLPTFGALSVRTSRIRVRARTYWCSATTIRSRDREAIRHARRDQRRAVDPRRRCRILARGVRAARRAVRRPRRTQADDAMRAARSHFRARAGVSRTALRLQRLRRRSARVRRAPMWVGGEEPRRSLRRARRARRRLGAVRPAHQRARPRCSRVHARPKRGASRADPIDVMLQSERPLDPLAEAARRHRATRAVSRPSAATGVNVRFVHHSPAHYREQPRRGTRA